ncbi:MAG: NnrS family protein, partial [Alphaproteobacteria bacterium]|nr:NnrS family protein [Alphaproteobacteria bacterium]
MATVSIEEPAADERRPRLTLLASGFRPFFLLAAWYAALALPLWLAAWTGTVDFAPPMGAHLWHAHEMLFGFAAAGLAGFLLTAAPNWTGTRPLSGAPLALLVAVWIAGRAGMLGLLPPAVAVAADLAFLPLLGLCVGRAIVARSGRRNGVLLVFLLALTLANAAVQLDLGVVDGTAALRTGVGLLVVLIGLIGGRIVPAFTQSGLRMAGHAATIAPAPTLDRLAVLALAVAVVADAAPVPAYLVAAAAGLAAVLHAVRLARWQGWRAGGLPLVWVLHLGYAFVVAGAALLAAARLDLVPASAALHAWSAGAVGTMLLAVMSRASLGHSGRTLAAGPALVAAYVLVVAGAALRVAGAAAEGEATLPLTLLGGAAWSLGYLTFAVAFLPVWLRARADG